MAHIRRANIHDVAALSPLIEDYWSFENLAGFESHAVSAALTQLLAEPQLGAGWIALADGVAIGYLLAVYVFSLEHRGLTAEIDEFFVSAAYRQRRVGRELLAAAEAEFVARGCTNVSLQLSRGNEAARAFYRRQGYAERAGFELLDKPLAGGF